MERHRQKPFRCLSTKKKKKKDGRDNQPSKKRQVTFPAVFTISFFYYFPQTTQTDKDGDAYLCKELNIEHINHH